MKKEFFGTALGILLVGCIVCGYPQIAQAGLFDGGFSGPLPIYNVNSNVDLATITTQINTYKTLMNQLTQLQNEAKNLAKLDPSSMATLNSEISSTLQQMKQVNQQLEAVGTDYSNLSSQWDATYKDFGDFNGMSATDYATYNKKIMEATQSKIKRALASQGLASDNNITADITTLNQLLTNSQNAQGAVAATQAASQIAALQVQEMLKMQRIMSDSFGAQALYYQQAEAKEKAAAQRATDFNSETDTTLRTEADETQHVDHYATN